jgi:hypothetical protein
MQNVIAGIADRGLDAAAILSIAVANFLRLFEQTQARVGVSSATA